MLSTAQLQQLVASATDKYIAIPLTAEAPSRTGAIVSAMAPVLERNPDATFAYSDYLADGKRVSLIPCPAGALRDGFDFGPVVVTRTDLARQLLDNCNRDYRYAGWYDLRLRLQEVGDALHIQAPLYEADPIHEGEDAEKSHFAYVDPANREVQIEMEQAVTDHLARIGALVNRDDTVAVNLDEGDFEVEASVIIPVRNRERTIRDAVLSALSQQAPFDYNVIVVDNHSTDRTGAILTELAAADPRLIVINPETESGHTYGIGGCWNIAINSPRCGRFAVQLDSDDLYSGPDTLARIVARFREDGCAMVVGAYTLTDIDGNIQPPGLIDHREWTDDNGPNNALRINGLGAPRAFFTPVARSIGFPDVSYGEDYAMGLAVSRKYRIGRIYDSLYLCRRWEDNTDHALSPEKVNRNNAYKDSLRHDELTARRAANAGRERERNEEWFSGQLAAWPDTAARYSALDKAIANEETFSLPGYPDFIIHKRLLAHRKASLTADISPEAIERRGCFLCREARPAEQWLRQWAGYEILVNPYPISPRHLTIAESRHTPQRIAGRIADICLLATRLPGYTVFYNGPKCGASAPDHFHFQAIQTDLQNFPVLTAESLPAGIIPVGRDVSPVPHFVISAKTPLAAQLLFNQLLAALPDSEPEPMMNLAATTVGDELRLLVLPRRAHRPACYGDIMVSPATVEMLGTFVTATEADFTALTPDKILEIYADVCIDDAAFSQTISRL